LLPEVARELRAYPRLAKPPPSVKGEASEKHHSPENGGPDPDRMADEPCDDDREQEARVSVAESFMSSELVTH
jgi:hypothetical protein